MDNMKKCQVCHKETVKTVGLVIFKKLPEGEGFFNIRTPLEKDVSWDMLCEECANSIQFLGERPCHSTPDSANITEQVMNRKISGYDGE